MKNKSTVQKGNEFEERVYSVFSKLLFGEKLPVSGGLSFIYLKKKYYSEQRKNDIVMDISIETFLEGAKEYSILTIIECKNYKQLVPVDDIEEFKAKLDQIAGKNVKGILISKNGFQSGAIDYAKSNGIALVRLVENEHINWDVYRTNKYKDTIEKNDNVILKGLINVSYHLESHYCFGYYNDKYYDKLSNVLQEMEINVSDDAILIEQFVNQNTAKIPFLNSDKIIESANILLRELPSKSSSGIIEVPIEKIAENVSQKYQVKITETNELGQNRQGERVIARFNPVLRIIEIDRQSDIHRKRFTIAHEIGHIILHSPYLTNPLSETEKTIIPSPLLDPKDAGRAEVQANIFASRLLMPEELFLPAFERIAMQLGYRERGNYLIYIDNQPVNRSNFYKLCYELSTIFNVSVTAVEYRLKRYKWVVDDRYKWKKAGDILGHIFN